MAQDNDARSGVVGPMRFDAAVGNGLTIGRDVGTAESRAESGASPIRDIPKSATRAAAWRPSALVVTWTADTACHEAADEVVLTSPVKAEP